MTSSTKAEGRLPISLPDSVGDEMRKILAEEARAHGLQDAPEKILDKRWDEEWATEAQIVLSAMSRVREETIELCAAVGDHVENFRKFKGDFEANQVAAAIRALKALPTPPSDLDRGESRASPLNKEVP